MQWLSFGVRSKFYMRYFVKWPLWSAYNPTVIYIGSRSFYTGNNALFFMSFRDIKRRI